jgi:hypothetical protein
VHVLIHIFLTSAQVGGEWSVSYPGRYTPGDKAPGTHLIGGWVGPRAGLDDVEKIKYLYLRGLEFRPLGSPARSHNISEELIVSVFTANGYNSFLLNAGTCPPTHTTSHPSRPESRAMRISNPRSPVPSIRTSEASSFTPRKLQTYFRPTNVQDKLNSVIFPKHDCILNNRHSSKNSVSGAGFRRRHMRMQTTLSLFLPL